MDPKVGKPCLSGPHFCTGNCQAKTSLNATVLVPVKGNCNATTYKGILFDCGIPSLWQWFGEGTHIGVIVRHTKTFGQKISVYKLFDVSAKARNKNENPFIDAINT